MSARGTPTLSYRFFRSFKDLLISTKNVMIRKLNILSVLLRLWVQNFSNSQISSPQSCWNFDFCSLGLFVNEYKSIPLSFLLKPRLWERALVASPNCLSELNFHFLFPRLLSRCFGRQIWSFWFNEGCLKLCTIESAWVETCVSALKLRFLLNPFLAVFCFFFELRTILVLHFKEVLSKGYF